jgi:hypothetical protein
MTTKLEMELGIDPENEMTGYICDTCNEWKKVKEDNGPYENEDGECICQDCLEQENEGAMERHESYLEDK